MSRIHRLSLAALALAALSLSSLSAHAQSNVRYENLVPPGTSGLYFGAGISPTGNTYTVANLNLNTGKLSGFIVSNGVSTPFSKPGAPANSYAYLAGINDSGKAAGRVTDLNGTNYGDFIYVGKDITKPTPQDFISPAPMGGTAQRYTTINNDGKVAMSYFDATGLVRGAIYDTTTQTFLEIPTVVAGRITDATAISSTGVVLGHYRDKDNLKHGYTYREGGIPIPLPEIPGIPNPAGISTFEYAGINANGLIHGYYNLGGSDFGSFLYDGTGYSFLNYPGAINTDNGWGISDTNQFLGSYYSSPTTPRAFLATVVPEPGSVALLIGMAGTGLMLRRRKNRK